MIKRKDPMSDKKEKVKTAGVAVRKVSKKVNFDEMVNAFSVDGPLVPLRSDVYFERTKESKPIVCVGMLHSIHEHDGSANIWDETHQEFYVISYRKELHLVKVRVPMLPTEGFQEPEKEPAVVANPQPEEGHEEAQDKIDVEHDVVSTDRREAARELMKEMSGDDPYVSGVMAVGEGGMKPKESIKFKLWVDDERNPPDETWVIARSTQEALDLIKMVGGLPHVMSLDHDLGMKADGTEDKIIHLLTELEEKYQKWPVPEYAVHSQNPVGRANTVAFMEAWKKSRNT